MPRPADRLPAAQPIIHEAHDALLAVDAELLVHVFDVGAHRVGRQVELLGHIDGRAAARQEQDVNNPGSYKKFLANSGVVVAAGDFKGNPQMCWSLLNEYMESVSYTHLDVYKRQG